jgi:hypothetical protein
MVGDRRGAGLGAISAFFTPQALTEKVAANKSNPMRMDMRLLMGGTPDTIHGMGPLLENWGVRK